MPHLILEYAADSGVSGLLDAVHHDARDTGLFTESHIRARARRVTECRVAAYRGRLCMPS